MVGLLFSMNHGDEQCFLFVFWQFDWTRHSGAFERKRTSVFGEYVARIPPIERSWFEEHKPAKGEGLREREDL